MPGARRAVVLLGRLGRRQYGYGDHLITAVAPRVGATQSPSSPPCKVTMPPGWKPCQRAYRTAPPPRRCTRSATSTSLNFRQSFRRAASAEIDPRNVRSPHGELALTAPAPSNNSPSPTRARPGCATPTSSAGASATVRALHKGGQFWTPIGGHFSTPIDTLDQRLFVGREWPFGLSAFGFLASLLLLRCPFAMAFLPL